MAPSYQNIQKRLQAFDLTGLFTQELMWNHFNTRDLVLTIDDLSYTLKPVAQRGMAVFECIPPTDTQFPRYATRRKIDTQVSKNAREHIIIFHDNAKTVQIWQWVKREAGKPSACREQLFYKGQSGDALVQKIQGIAFSIDDEPTVTESVAKVGAAFDVEKVTKKFYELFKKEHDAFLKFTKGIPDENLQRWYASVMLNRLMFIYFIQKKGFLGGDQHYLTNKLGESKGRGKDKFYRDFLCSLFFEGFAKREGQRSADTNTLLGHVPYLNGGLFLKHQIEELHGTRIEVPDKAFERIFDFFEQYDWHLDDRPTRTGREINPDVLGYVFEKYINQKEMGAYYTKEDITGYICQNTIVPALFDMARKSCKIAFEGEHSIWRLLQDDPDRYIYSAMLKGMDTELPNSIAAGLEDVSKRGDWNKLADPEYALPTETWREVVARRSRCEEMRQKLASGEIRSINDLITYNLDIRRFAEEVIANCEGPELLRAFYKAIAGSVHGLDHGVSVLDPACGSGAFLFAALNILERLYDTCLVRMQAFVDDLARSDEKHSPEKFSDFRNTLEGMNDKSRHPSPRYFILKSIILNNLYGVDIMEEATEICKLRLFLKLVAQVNPGEKIEPLPDIDFNIRAGNSLVGFVTEQDLHDALGSKFDFENKLDDIKERAKLAELAYERFRQMQTDHSMTSKDFSDAKSEVQRRLDELRAELDEQLAREYGARADGKGLEHFEQTHQPFHWFVEFFGIMRQGGFDSIIGNPPYVEYKDVKTTYMLRDFETLECGDLYAFFVERSQQIVSRMGRLGLIVPISIFGTDGFLSLHRLCKRNLRSMWLSCFANRPAQLFEGAQKRLTIVVAAREDCRDRIYTTDYLRWKRVERDNLFPSRLNYLARESTAIVFPASIEKLGSQTAASIFAKIISSRQSLAGCVRNSGKPLYYTRKFGYFLAFLNFVPKMVDIRTGRSRLPSELKILNFRSTEDVLAAIAALSSSTFFWFWNTLSDCRNLNKRDILAFPLDLDRIPDALKKDLTELGKLYIAELRNTSRMMIKSGCRIETFRYAECKQHLDEIDRLMGSFFELTADEIDSIVSYDMKYRIGVNEGD